ncbi:GDSL esterase/lipase [Camellia lanceoleosa]|uniref:GDSL esterase/lipase n=1 Tax=Camellia lanceoleosa TaxID=1840588 RepID=A0ACC0HBS2_9ERIC|nr:GDSL esterase/lipase [Camellia lanceoleosa]
MGKSLLPFTIFFRLLMVEVQAIRGSYKPQDSNVKLFVFGDSYVDTGNAPKLSTDSWRKQYGVSYPGKPTGRFSVGCILTDYIEWGEFCLWGTGVFSTMIPLPNMATQINYFQQLVEKKVHTQNDLDSSIALISLAGNNYFAYLRKKGSKKGLPCFAWKLINQLTLKLKSIHDMGVRKIGVVAIEPLGCLPWFTVPSSVQRCNRNLDLAAKSHNLRLHRAAHKLRRENNGSVFPQSILFELMANGGTVKRLITEKDLVQEYWPACSLK